MRNKEKKNFIKAQKELANYKINRFYVDKIEKAK